LQLKDVTHKINFITGKKTYMSLNVPVMRQTDREIMT